jgi:cyclic pyranopterin phosphate synthase
MFGLVLPPSSPHAITTQHKHTHARQARLIRRRYRRGRAHAVRTATPAARYHGALPLLDVILLYDCNLACDYCTITPAMRARALTTADVVRALRDGRAEGYDRVSFTGGEPTIRADLLGLVRQARALGYASVKVQSNGLVFATAANVARLIDAGVTEVHVSIHTHDPRAYDALVRREGAFPLMVAGLRNLVASAIPLAADVIVKTDTAPRLVDAIAWLHQQGVRAADLWFVSLTDGNRANVDSMPRMTEALPAMRAALHTGRALGMRMRSLHVPRCLLGDDRGFAFDPAAEGVKVVTPDATFALTRSKLTGQVHVDACEGCEHRAICPGVRADYLERYGDAEIRASRG